MATGEVTQRTGLDLLTTAAAVGSDAVGLN